MPATPAIIRLRWRRWTARITGAIVSRSFWRSLGGLTCRQEPIWLPKTEKLSSGSLERYDFVEAWQTRETVTDAAASNLNSAAMVAYILIVFGGGLACVVISQSGHYELF